MQVASRLLPCRQQTGTRPLAYRERAVISRFIADVTVCPVCLTNFHSRVRLLCHLGDERIRSKKRMTTCNAVFSASNPNPIPLALLTELSCRDRTVRSAASKSGHTHELAVKPCTKRALNTEASFSNVKRRRLRQKTPAVLYMFSRQDNAV